MKPAESGLLCGSVLTAALLAFAACGGATSAGESSPAGIASARGEDARGEIAVGGRTRSYLLHRPPGHDPREPVPLVVVLHGGGGNGAGMARISGFSEAADREGFLVAYPDGSGALGERLLTWNAGNCCGWALEHEVDDVAFLAALLDRLETDLAIDARRIYVTGLSNGGMMAYRAACELSGRIAAIAPVAGAMNLEICAAERPVSVVVFHGTADEHVPYGGGAPTRLVDRRHPRVDAPVSEAVSFWARRDGCAAEPRAERRGAILVETWEPCDDRTAVALYTIEGQGHAWPGGTKWAARADTPTRALDATATMWAFFRDHPRP